jgi:LysR family transcriptional regulator of gallate degradation
VRINNLNLRHLRAFSEVASHNSISRAAAQIHLSQPAITQALSKLESLVGVDLFDRRGSGMLLNDPGKLYLPRVKRALGLIETGAHLALCAGPKSGAKGFTRFDRLVTSTQLRSLLAMAGAGNFSLAARAIGISQPSLHRTARDLERLSGIPLFKRVSQGFDLTPSAKIFAQHAQLAFSELDQGIEEIESWRGLDTGRVVIGTMPLARTAILPQAINGLLNVRPKVDVSVIDGPYDDLLHGLRYAQIDLLIGALRDPLPIDDVTQEPLFSDPLAIVARCGHPLSGKSGLKIEDLAAYPWAVPRTDTPTRDYFENLISSANAPPRAHVIETSSLILIRGLLVGSDRLTIMSAHQMRHEEDQGVLQRLDFAMRATSRNIGITVRKDWRPTATQSLFLDLLREAGRQVHG